MSEFTRSGGIYSLELSIDEAHILINLVEQLLELLGEGDFSHHYDESDPFAQLMAQLKAAPDEIAPPEDPVLYVCYLMHMQTRKRRQIFDATPSQRFAVRRSAYWFKYARR